MLLERDRTAIDAERTRAAVEVARIRRAMLADMPQDFVARWLREQGYSVIEPGVVTMEPQVWACSCYFCRQMGHGHSIVVEPPRGWPRMVEDE